MFGSNYFGQSYFAEGFAGPVTLNIAVSDTITTSENTVAFTNILYRSISDTITTAENVNPTLISDVHRQPDIYQDGPGVKIV